MLKKLVKAIACLGAAVMALSMGAYAQGKLITAGGKSYVTQGENLFTNGDFSDNSGKGMDIWYTGKNNGGHVTVDNFIPAPNTKNNLTKITDGRIVLNQFEPQTDRIDNGFYFGRNGNNTFLVENVNNDDWRKCTWNGEYSLMAFVPIEKGKRYYFSFECCTSNNSKASARYGTINGSDFVSVGHGGETDNSMKWQSMGLDLKNGGKQNIGGTGTGKWAKWECILEPKDEADYFLFNTYWLQMSSYLCLDNFELYEIEEINPTVTAKLGWNEGFTIDFIFGGIDKITDKTISALAYNESEFVDAVTDNITGDFSLRPGSVNNFYKSTVTVGGLSAESDDVSVYSLLMEDISSNSSNYTYENVSKDRIAAVNKALKEGGFAVDGGKPTEALMKIMDNKGNDTYTLKSAVTNLGIYFTKENDEGKYDTITISDNEAVLSSSNNVQTVEVVMALDAVQLEFVPEEIQEAVVDNETDVESGSFEEIM